jgi:integrase/recombinase XerD
MSPLIEKVVLRFINNTHNVVLTRLGFVRSFFRYWSAIDPRTEIPPMGLFPHRAKRAKPYIYSDKEIEQLLNAAKNLPPSTSLRPWTYYTLFGLLAVTGMRISEVIHLEYGDVDLDQMLLTIRMPCFYLVVFING